MHSAPPRVDPAVWVEAWGTLLLIARDNLNIDEVMRMQFYSRSTFNNRMQLLREHYRAVNTPHLVNNAWLSGDMLKRVGLDKQSPRPELWKPAMRTISILAHGYSLYDAAAQQGLAYCTVKEHMRNVRVQMGSLRREALIHAMWAREYFPEHMHVPSK